MEQNRTSVIDISIVILTYNTYDLTRACVSSVLAYSNRYVIEIIVVDNASTDETVIRLKAEFPNVQVIANPTNLGFARGNNIGLRIARGRYLMLLNSDTEVRRGALAALIEFMDAHGDAGACGPMLLNPDGSLQPSGRDLPSVLSVLIDATKLYRLWKKDLYREVGRDYAQVARVGEVSGAALLVRRQIYQQVGGLDENFFAYYEDIDWCKRISEAGYRIFYVPSAKIVHHWRVTSSLLSEMTWRVGQNSQRYYFAKHHGVVAHGLIQILLAAKQVSLIAISWFRRDPRARQFHMRMLANVFTPLGEK